MKTTGTVYLVGAGPGDTGLLTLRGAELLGRADVVVYDALVNQELLALAPKSAEIIYGGKRANAPWWCGFERRAWSVKSMVDWLGSVAIAVAVMVI